ISKKLCWRSTSELQPRREVRRAVFRHPSRERGRDDRAPGAVYPNFVTPGSATGGSGSFTDQSYAGGVRSSFDFSAISHVTCWPVYAAIRPMIASSVLFAMYSPLLIGLPARIAANSSSCSVWYIWLPGHGYAHLFAVSIHTPFSRSDIDARPLDPST